MMDATESRVDALLEAIKSRVEAAGVFGPVEVSDGMLRCAASGAGAEAWYRVERDDGRWHVALVTPDRWLSESIEADLMHFGDPIEELVEEELVELGQPAGRPVVRHYRSEDLLYTFRTPIPMPAGDTDDAASLAANYLLAYEAAFRELGDMTADDDES